MSPSEYKHHVLNLINAINVHTQLIELSIKENVDKKKINCYVEEIKTSIETLVEFIKEREIT